MTPTEVLELQRALNGSGMAMTLLGSLIIIVLIEALL